MIHPTSDNDSCSSAKMGKGLYAALMQGGGKGVTVLLTLVALLVCDASDELHSASMSSSPVTSRSNASQPFTASVTGMRPDIASCRNDTTGQAVPLQLAGSTAWDCQASGLVFAPGESIKTSVRGTSNNPAAGVGGSVTGILPLEVSCWNLTTDQSILHIPLYGKSSWDCTEKGLTVHGGDRIRMSVHGTTMIRPSNLTCTAPRRPSTGSPVMIQPAFPQLRLFQSLVGLFQAPGDNAWWYGLQRHGRILRFANDPTVTRKSIVLDIENLVNAEGEGGLLGMAFHPNFATNGQVFLHYTGHGAPQVTYISRFTSTDGGATLDPASEQVILDFPQNQIRHKGGHIAFGPDGYLYISHGDGGNKSEAQNTDNWFGTLLRIDVDNGIPYAIPPDNPFAAGGGAPEIYAWGFRNPWRWSFDRATGAIWLGDVGAESWEEINRVQKGRNYGWPIREGKHCFPPEVESCSTADLIDPIVEYPHDEGPTAVIGGYVYRGRAIPALRGIYLYANYSTATIWGIFRDQDGNPTSRLLTDGGVGTIWSFAEDQEGEVYLAASGRIGRLVPAPAAEEDNTFPQLLSATGCVDPNYPTEPAPGLIPYDVQVPFWSDGAQKRRWIALPEGTTIHIGADGDWELPIGTVLMKRFRLGGRLIETRLLVRHADGGWAGYSYEWNDDQTDATLLPGGKTKIINGQSYAIPSRTQCIQCHNAEAGYTLGLETLQMNRGYKYPTAVSGWLNQMKVYEHMGLFDTPLSVPPRDLPSLPRTTNEHARLARRARAYLHANCAYCHRPEGLGQGPADFLFQTTEMGVCDVPPTVDDFGIPEARLLAPGDPAKSIISLRLHALDSSRMPPIGKHVVDSDGVALIDAWITSLRSCP